MAALVGCASACAAGMASRRAAAPKRVALPKAGVRANRGTVVTRAEMDMKVPRPAPQLFNAATIKVRRSLSYVRICARSPELRRLRGRRGG